MRESSLRQDYSDGGQAAPSPSAAPPGFLCDEMLQGLGRWLRVAGHDTAIARHGLPDEAVIARVLREGRLLLTCDRALAQRPAVRARAVVLPADGLDAAALALGRAFGLDWLHAPFSRCLLDNATLEAAGEGARASLPPKARDVPGPLHRCPRCRRLYWPGSHVKRMTARLDAWQAETAAL